MPLIYYTSHLMRQTMPVALPPSPLTSLPVFSRHVLTYPSRLSKHRQTERSPEERMTLQANTFCLFSQITVPYAQSAFINSHVRLTQYDQQYASKVCLRLQSLINKENRVPIFLITNPMRA